ncbi:hypothetical protein Q4485_15035 [Granulosicoccaceae sp. 1_MG-2023]|nr:hypothetical protein [Granulosicoccaceae sp. 1_MG-2023]
MRLPPGWQIQSREDGARGHSGKQDRLIVDRYVLQANDNAGYRAAIESCRQLLHESMLEAANDAQYEDDGGFEIIHFAPALVVERHQARQRDGKGFLCQYSIVCRDCMIRIRYEGPEDVRAQQSQLEEAIRGIIWHDD